MLATLALLAAAVPMLAGATGGGTQCTFHTTDVVSDTTNTVEGGGNAAAVSTPYNSAWTASIPGATWIWSTATVTDPTTDQSATFDKTFTVSGDVTSATLDIAADNSYQVWINGTLVGQDASEDNYSSYDEYTSTVVSALHSGTNTITVTVKNWGEPGSTPSMNPAGLLYKLSIDSKTCVPLSSSSVTVRNNNTATVTNTVVTTTNTGGNTANGGGNNQASVGTWHFSTPTTAGSHNTAVAGSGGTIHTGSATSYGSAFNIVNRNFVRIR